ncbi:MAG: hypothetical protein LBK56_03005 [Gracilibacteraceae bacterium]|jgi:hypothetical protein|nr:hypothetical protein [Gracilibacteraceae bacterium]
MSVIYIICPARAYTGGPELLHQLCYKLRQYGYDSRMIYVDIPDIGIPGSPMIHPNLAKYGNPVSQEFADAPENIVVAPETLPWLLESATRGVSVLWWLSVDNYSKSVAVLAYPHEKLLENPRLVHFVQSEYARDFVENTLGVEAKKVCYLADYLREEYFLPPDLSFSASARLPFVLLNPQKGVEFTNKLLQTAAKNNSHSIKWVPLAGYTPEQMAVLMRVSSLYIDFGPHPGMDRIPREAAACGCCVVTGRDGSAAYAADVPIPDMYKIDAAEENIPRILDLIYHIVADYDRHIGAFAPYRQFVAAQEARFEKDMLAAFSPLAGPPPIPFDAANLREKTEACFTAAGGLCATIAEGMTYAERAFADRRPDQSREMAELVDEALLAVTKANRRLSLLLRKAQTMDEA